MARPTQSWCWYCRQEIPIESEVCPHCSKPLSDAKKVVRCPSCGRYLLRSSEQCVQCGEPLEYDQPPLKTAAPSESPDDFFAAGAMQANANAAQSEPQQSDSATATDMMETLRTLEELENKERREAQQAVSTRKVSKIALSVAMLALVALAAVFFFTRPGYSNRADVPKSCALGAHQWVEADCTHPKTCSVCGKTDGEPLGHHFVDNVCSVCGAYNTPFFFSATGCERKDSIVWFWGNVKNYTEGNVKELKLQLDLYDADKSKVYTQQFTVAEDAPIYELENFRWEVSCDDTGLKWKYWRVCAKDYMPAEQMP